MYCRDIYDVMYGSIDKYINLILFGAIQKLRNGQRGEGVDDFVTYRYVNFEGEGGYLMKLLRNGK